MTNEEGLNQDEIEPEEKQVAEDQDKANENNAEIEKSETKDTEVKPDNDAAEKPQKKRDWFVTILFILIVVLIAGFVYLYLSGGFGTAETETATEASETVTASAPTVSPTPSAVLSQTAAASDQANITAANQTLTDFLNAKKTRDLATASPFMTVQFATTFSQESFAGVSSPSMGRFEIQTTLATVVGQTYTATVRVWQNLNNAEVGYSDNIYTLKNVAGKFLVDSITEGKFIEL